VKILWVKANKLLPLHSGGDIRSYNILRQLAAHHEVTLLSYYDGTPDAEYEAALNQHFPDAVLLATGKNDVTVLRRGLDYLFRLPNQEPYAVGRFACAQVEHRLKKWYLGQTFDAVVCDFLDAAVNFPLDLTIPTVLFQHNVESEIWRRHATRESNPVKKLMYRVEFAKMLAYEQKVVRKFHHVIAVSQHDRELMTAWVDASKITVVPTGVDLRQFRPDPSGQGVGPLVMFVGAMDWEPNIDAVEHFCQESWPAIRSRFATARFRIVGRNPDRRVQKLVSSSIEVTGSVPSVVEHLREAAVVVIPLRVGGGTRLKIYEAMAVGKAVVSTSVGAEGLDVTNGLDIVLADNPDAFAEAVVMLLRDGERRHNYERAAAACAARHDWPRIGEKFVDVLQALVNGTPVAERSYVPAIAGAERRIEKGEIRWPQPK
jgi:glycosyltransferase involved in cell wall biosynthesis